MKMKQFLTLVLFTAIATLSFGGRAAAQIFYCDDLPKMDQQTIQRFGLNKSCLQRPSQVARPPQAGNSGYQLRYAVNTQPINHGPNDWDQPNSADTGSRQLQQENYDQQFRDFSKDLTNELDANDALPPDTFVRREREQRDYHGPIFVFFEKDSKVCLMAEDGSVNEKDPSCHKHEFGHGILAGAWHTPEQLRQKAIDPSTRTIIAERLPDLLDYIGILPRGTRTQKTLDCVQEPLYYLSRGWFTIRRPHKYYSVNMGGKAFNVGGPFMFVPDPDAKDPIMVGDVVDPACHTMISFFDRCTNLGAPSMNTPFVGVGPGAPLVPPAPPRPSLPPPAPQEPPVEQVTAPTYCYVCGIFHKTVEFAWGRGLELDLEDKMPGKFVRAYLVNVEQYKGPLNNPTMVEAAVRDGKGKPLAVSDNKVIWEAKKPKGFDKNGDVALVWLYADPSGYVSTCYDIYKMHGECRWGCKTLIAVVAGATGFFLGELTFPHPPIRALLPGKTGGFPGGGIGPGVAKPPFGGIGSP